MTERRSGRRPCLLGALGLSALLLMALAPVAAATAGAGERITAYDVNVEVEATGSILVTEAIDYDFGTNSRHGIYRDIPVRIGYDSRYERIYPLHVISVAGSPGTPAGYSTENAGNYKRIKIGSSKTTITGAHRYTIAYRVDHALDGLADHDELDWNAVGTQWSVPIDRVTVRVTTPTSVGDVACFGGGFGSHLGCSGANRDAAGATFSQTGVGPGQGVTVVVGFATGAVPAPVPDLDERWRFSKAFSVTPTTGGASLVLLLAVVAGFARLAWRTGRDRRFAGSAVDAAFGNDGGQEQPVGLRERVETPVEFVPPDGLRPGQVGTLVDEKANTLDVTATIVDLAVRGYLRIDEIAKKGFFGKPDWTLTKLKDGDDLRPYEHLLLDSLFPRRTEVRLSALRNTFATKLKEVEDALYDDALEQGWFVARPDRVRRRWLLVGCAATAAALITLVVLAAVTQAALVAVPLLVGGLLLLAGCRYMPRRTAKGTGVLRRAEGFRRFIDESEKDRARVAEQQHLFSEYLPYAIVFGATEKWARAFAGLDGQLPEPAWYGGSQSFTVVGFSHSIDGFAVTTAGTIASTPSGGGSGGFSGGGGGGGGGGSW